MSKDDIVKGEILDNAARLFQKWGYNKTTIEDIAKAAGKGKSSLYYYYKDKEEIFTGVISREVSAMFSVINEQIEKCPTAEGKLRVYVETYLHEMEKASNVYNIVCGEMLGNVSLLKRLSEKFDAMAADIIRKIIEMGVKNKEFFLPKKIDTTIISFFILNSIGIVLFDKILMENMNGYSSMSSVMSWMFLEGLKRKESV
jgi:AcrR family transcriptional regulator